MQFIIVTGMSGAGKSTVVHILEDIGYYCIDNMPPTLVTNFVTLCQNSNIMMEKIAFVVDARSGDRIMRLADEIEEFRKSGNKCEVLFLEASDETIIKRYKETRRKHPHAKGGLLIDGIAMERRLLSEIRTRSDYIIDTSGLLTKQLREKILALFESRKKYESINVSVVSFGFKRGIPLDSDLMFDVRFLPNPFYEPDLKELTGLDAPVRDFVFKNRETQTFVDKLHDMIEFLLPQYVEEGKMQLVISIGCTGGKHRSVALAEELGSFLREKNYYTVVSHRDIKLEQGVKQ
ncbi:MAG: RNase adapter RapZ [Ruminococcaceae bacterium]|nr:RNase adapter RapZ [Oscillospiraceae bacterium]